MTIQKSVNLKKNWFDLFVVLRADWIVPCFCKVVNSSVFVLHSHASFANHQQVHAVEARISYVAVPQHKQ